MELSKTIELINKTFSESDDLLMREITVCEKRCAFFFLDGGSDKQLFEQDVLRPLGSAQYFAPPYLDSLQSIVCFSETIKQIPLTDAPGIIAEGDIAFFIDGEENAYVFSMRKLEKRSISEPPTASVLKGPREGFIEEIKTNLSLVRRRVKSPDLVVKMLKVGRYSTTAVAMLYVNGIADNKIVRQISERIKQIDVDGIVDSAYIVAFLQRNKNSFFVQAGTSEKPDVVSAKLLEGRVAILVDGSPIAVTLPYLLFEDVQDGYDYYSGDWRASIVRIFRIFGALLTVLLPGAYVALQVYHFQLLPLKFLMTLMSATSGIPFPPPIEMLFVLLLFEILNQASIRMPRYMGISLSVVGAIVLGDTAVKAGLISSPAVLVIALSAIGIFCVPDQVGTMSILRLLFLCFSAVLGFLGIVVMVILITAYLASLENYGTPYLAPYAPRINPDLKDGLLKSGTTNMQKRPYSIPTANHRRMKGEE